MAEQFRYGGRCARRRDGSSALAERRCRPGRTAQRVLRIERLEDRRLLSMQPLSTPLAPIEPASSFIDAGTAAGAIDSRPVNDFIRWQPLGGLVSVSRDNVGTIDSSEDIDDFEVLVQSGQTVAAIVTPTAAEATLSVELVGVAGPVSGVAAGEPVVLPATLMPAGGLQTLRIGGDAPSGYTIDVVLNAEVEAIVGDTTSENTVAIDPSRLALGGARYAAVARSEPELIAVGPGRLFAVPLDGSDQIVELSPTTGAETNRFFAPDPTAGRTGLAFDGRRLYFLNGFGSDTLYELDPDTGTVLASNVISIGSGGYDGLAYLDGKVYILDPLDRDIHVFDPVTQTFGTSLDVDGVNPGALILGGLAAITGPDALLVTDSLGTVMEIDPATGVITSSFATGTGNIEQGLAVLGGQIYVGPSAGTFEVSVFDRQGGFVRNFEITHLVDALGGNDVLPEPVPLDGESNDTLAAAVASGVDAGGGRFYGTGTIGDNPGISAGLDVDMIAVALDVGDRLVVDVDAAVNGSTLDAVLTLFDSSGAMLLQNDDAGSLDPFIDYTAEMADTYYIGVSGFGNLGYDPDTEGSGTEGSIGDYAIAIGANPAGPLWPDNAPAVVAEVDRFTLDLTGLAGETIDVVLAGQELVDFSGEVLSLLDTDGATILAIGASLDGPVNGLGIFDFVVPDDGIYGLEVTSSLTGDYAIVVTASLRFDREPNDAADDLLQSLNNPTTALGALGTFQAINLLGEANDVIANSVNNSALVGGHFTGSGAIGDNQSIAAGLDVDLLEIQLAVDDRLTVDVDASDIGSPLDPVITLFDAAGQLVDQNDDAASLDPFLDFMATLAGTYYIGISGHGNVQYDPHEEGSGTTASTGFYHLAVEVNGTATAPTSGKFAPKEAIDPPGEGAGSGSSLPVHLGGTSGTLFAKDDPLASVVGHDLALLASVDTALVGNLAGGNALERVQIREGRVLIEAAAEGDTDWLLDDLDDLGLTDAVWFGRLVSGLLPIENIAALANLESLRFARPVYRPITSAGEVITQGDVAIGSSAVRQLYGLDGSGVTVGVLSDSYDLVPGSDAAGDVASGDLPGVDNPFGRTTPVNVLDDSENGIDEGRAMLQIVHDIAPGADLAFHTAFGGQAGFANGILDLRHDAGADVIVDDVLYFEEPMFQDGVIAQAVDAVVADGAAYFAAAGNQGRDSWQDTYRPSGLFDPEFGTELHDFDPSAGIETFQSITVPPFSVFTLVFQWDSPFFSVSGGAGATSDMDIFVFDANGTTVIDSATTSNLGGDALEVFTFINNGMHGTDQFNLALGLAEGDAPGLMKWVGFGAVPLLNEYATHSGTSFGHANAASAFAVGAANYLDTPAFGTEPATIDPRSSAGGVPILRDIGGNPLHEVRQTPRAVAPNNVNNTFFGINTDGDTLPNFSGTSAAAPHAAAVAALLKQAAPGATPQEIYDALTSTSLDMDDPFTEEFDVGFDDQTGFGLIDAEAALVALLGDDVVGPRVVSIDPATGAFDGLMVSTITVEFTEPVSQATAEDAANYLLIEAGGNGLFESGAGDDTVIAVTPSLIESARVELAIDASLAFLPVGHYQLTIQGDSSIEDLDGAPLGSLSGTGGGADHVHQFEIFVTIPAGGDLYSVNLDAGQVLVVHTSTPFDDPAATPINRLDPELIVYGANGFALASDQDSADGKNAQLWFRAAETGTYLLQVLAQSGAGEYFLRANVAVPDFPVGDYNQNGTVDLADYVLWKDNQGAVVTPGSRADGNFDGRVDRQDYNLWMANFGNTLPPPASGGSTTASPNLEVNQSNSAIIDTQESATAGMVTEANPLRDGLFAVWVDERVFSPPQRFVPAASDAARLRDADGASNSHLLLALTLAFDDLDHANRQIDFDVVERASTGDDALARDEAFAAEVATEDWWRGDVS